MSILFPNAPAFNRAEVLTPGELISKMFENTSEDGRLVVPGFPDDETEIHSDIQARMAWTEPDRAAAEAAFNSLFEALREIADQDYDLDSTADTARRELGNPLFGVWKVYLQDFDYGELGKKAFFDIAERRDGDGAEKAEEIAFRSLLESLEKQSALRLGRRICAYEFIRRAGRVYKLMVLNAPAIVVNEEAKVLAQALALNRYAVYTRNVVHE